MTYLELYQHITALADTHQNRDLETYLLALYHLTEQYKDKELTPELLLQLISDAFTADPAVFNEDWLGCCAAPDENILSRKFTKPQIKGSIDTTAHTNVEGIEYTFEVLKFQIAELHKMRDNQLKNEMRYFGITSETGNLWYNFDPFTNLQCGAACFMDNADNEADEMTVTWQTLGELLENGRIYE